MIDNFRVYIDKNVALNFGAPTVSKPENHRDTLFITLGNDSQTSYIRKKMVCFLHQANQPESFGTIENVQRVNSSVVLKMRVEPKIKI
jgi:hypothetical protein